MVRGSHQKPANQGPANQKWWVRLWLARASVVGKLHKKRIYLMRMSEKIITRHYNPHSGNRERRGSQVLRQWSDDKRQGD